MEWSIQEIAREAGTTSRTLRHYGDLGLLAPSRTGANGYRYYDQGALVRLQRILLLRELGLPLPAIKDVLEGQRDASAALRTHLLLLEQEQMRIGRQIASVRTTLHRTEEGEELMAGEVFDGFDHTVYEREVTERWGREAYAEGDRWWRGLSREERADFQGVHDAIARDYGAAREAGLDAGGEAVQHIAGRHCAWLAGTTTVTRSYVTGLAGMYVADPRFGKNYDRYGDGTAVFVRDALTIYAQHRLTD
ncbi:MULTISPECIES: MerR family transcriptional regulator [Streptomyces]|uniref:DNA-binding transcriptional MerR regulator n=1 Tax=Streptomyces clavifer TaxID=68188 RepID=A0ABS4V856_9ACTN|nr:MULTISPECIES: MerR family transcriptional regulator [Streptomyces]MBP2360089.1 DNA-binding transcriptional MerR regulator [Streptomyces clavifer]MDX2748458.1 MerR family transcriptional regulator [Streptomyces sp. NRRL_B-2557]MDX3064519.1 MerR family transcriptional regulator [Streptomyces sp. ND04-05B]GHA96512.1 MerR family transcriptional regulator [Streptomyces clavifer]